MTSAGDLSEDLTFLHDTALMTNRQGMAISHVAKVGGMQTQTGMQHNTSLGRT